MHEEMRSTSFLIWPQNQGLWFVSGLTSKPLGQISWLSLKTKFGGLLVVWPQNHWVRFPGLGLKTGNYGLLVVLPRNHWDGFPGLGHKTGNKALVIWASKSLRGFPGLGLKTMRATVSLLCHKTDGRMKMVREMRVGNNHVFALSTNLVLRFYCLFDFRNIGVKLEHFKKLQEHLEIHQI
jgi:hypothetical protein